MGVASVAAIKAARFKFIGPDKGLGSGSKGSREPMTTFQAEDQLTAEELKSKGNELFKGRAQASHA